LKKKKKRNQQYKLGEHSSISLPKSGNTGLVVELKNVMLLCRTWSHEELYKYLYYLALLDLSLSPLGTLHLQSTTSHHKSCNNMVSLCGSYSL